MLSNFLVNHARSKKGKLSVSSKGFFLKSDLKENLKKTSPNDYWLKFNSWYYNWPLQKNERYKSVLTA